MRMRKSLATSHDLISGEVTTLEKMKPENSLVRGLSTIELFDAATGKKVHETNAENFVSVAWEDVQKAMARYVFFMDRVYVNDNYLEMPFQRNFLSAQGNYSDIFGKTFPQVNSLFTNIYLTNYNGAERPLTERSLRGNVVGWAGREVQYVGADTQKGSFNSAESFKDIEKKQFHFVWDFPTHASNGTFQSLYWGYSDSNPLSYDRDVIGRVPLPEGYVIDNDVKGVVFKDNKLYVMVKTTATSRYAIAVIDVDLQGGTAAMNAQTPIMLEFSDISTSNRRPTGFGFMSDGTIVVGLQYTSANTFELRRYSTSGERINFPDGRASYSTSSQNSVNRSPIWVDSTNDFVYTANIPYTTNTEDNGHAYLDYYTDLKCYSLADFSFAKPPIRLGRFDYEAQYQFAPFLDENVIFYKSNGTSHIVALDGTTMKVSDDYQGLAPLADAFTGVGRFVKNDGSGEPTEYRVYSTNSGNSVFIYSKSVGMIGGRNLLPSPITKTSEYTMKITYDLFFE